LVLRKSFEQQQTIDREERGISIAGAADRKSLLDISPLAIYTSGRSSVPALGKSLEKR